jgi:hypothetical protein
MPYDHTHSGGGGGGSDPEHDRAALSAVADAAVAQVDMNAEINGLCKRCARNMAMSRLVIACLMDVSPEHRREAVQAYREMFIGIFDRIAESS